MKAPNKNGKASQVKESPLANLSSRATTQSATAQKQHGPTKQVTGQHLLNTFVLDKEDTTKLQLIKTMVPLTPKEIGSALADMVELAKKQDIANGIEEKQVTKSGPIYRNAANSRSVIQRVYGALKFAPDVLEELGFTDKLGYHPCSALAKKALDQKEIKWSGERGLTVEERETKAYKALEERALKEVMKTNVRQADESYQDYVIRCSTLVEDQIASIQQEKQDAKVQAEVKRLVELDPDMAQAVAKGITKYLKDMAKQGAMEEELV